MCSETRQQLYTQLKLEVILDLDSVAEKSTEQKNDRTSFLQVQKTIFELQILPWN